MYIYIYILPVGLPIGLPIGLPVGLPIELPIVLPCLLNKLPPGHMETQASISPESPQEAAGNSKLISECQRRM